LLQGTPLFIATYETSTPFCLIGSVNFFFPLLLALLQAGADREACFAPEFQSISLRTSSVFCEIKQVCFALEFVHLFRTFALFSANFSATLCFVLKLCRYGGQCYGDSSDGRNGFLSSSLAGRSG
jgi:hypothetical protein